MFVLGLQGSPRKNGNTDIMLQAFMDKAAAVGAVTHTVQAAKAGIIPCKGCGYCEKSGKCAIGDDPMATEIFGLLRQADVVVAASPVYFYGVSAQLKVLIDRCQTLWARKYVFNLKDPLAATRQGILFSVAASRGRQLFEGVNLTAKYFFDAIDARFEHALTYRGIEAKGDISGRKGMDKDLDTLIEKTILPMADRKKVLFISREGSLRAPLAAAMVQQRHGNRICTAFAGTHPAPNLSSTMLMAMQTRGMDLFYRRPPPPDQALHGTLPDLVIVVDNRTSNGPIPGVKTLHWPLPVVPADDENAVNRLIRDIEARIDSLAGTIEKPKDKK